MKKMIVLLLAMVMVLAMSITAFAQTVNYTGTDGDGATITINNPAKGETYAVHKLFDATVSSDGSKIAYQGTVPTSLSDYFYADTKGYIHPKDAILDRDAKENIIGTKMTDALKTALEGWAKNNSNITAQAVSSGDELVFTGLPYGYYVMTTTHETGTGDTAKAFITVTSTKPNASIYDKNSNEPSADKTVEKATYTIGDTIKYTATFGTTNYMGSGSDAQPVLEYVISDTLPPYLSNVKVTKITIGGKEYKVNEKTPQFDSNKQIIIKWVNDETIPTTNHKYTHAYADGAQIVVNYEATLTSTTNINKADKNTVSIRPNVDNGTEKEPWEDEWNDSAEITTYAAALKKVDGAQNGPVLDGAKFKVKGLTVTETEAGVYTVVSYDPSETATLGTEMTTKDGMLYIVGLASGVTLTVTETEAPAGYNKLTETFTISPQVLTKQLYSTSGYEKYDKDGNLIERVATSTTDYTEVTKNLNELDAAAYQVINNKGIELPSTGGMGTKLFYVLGTVLVLGAGILLITKRRMSR